VGEAQCQFQIGVALPPAAGQPDSFMIFW
jgi:hypothetical protein